MNEKRAQGDRLAINLFGEFKYQIVDGVFQSLKSRKSEAVLLALALCGDTGMSRNALVDMLWPDLKRDRARAGLRQALSRIRSLIPNAFIAPRSGWVALADKFVSCDLWNLNSQIQAKQLNDASLPAAPFLTLFPCPTPRFEDWAISQRRVCLEELRRNLEELIKDGKLSLRLRNRACLVLSTLTQTDEARVATILDLYLETKELAKYTKRRREYIDLLDKQLGLKPSIQFLTKYTENSNDQGGETHEQEDKKSVSTASSPILAIVEKFHLIGAKDSHSYLAQSVPEEITKHLTRQEWFDVKAINPDITNISGNGGASFSHAYLVEGNLRFSQNHFLVSVRLSNQASGKIFWSNTFDVQFSDEQGGLVRIIDIISETLLTKMVESAADYAATFPDQIPADDWVNTMKARRLFWQTSQENNYKAKNILQPIIEKNTAPIAALVTATFTRLLTLWSAWEDDWDEQMRDARHIAEKAVRLYPTDPWSHFALATCFCAMRKHKDSMRTIEHALTLHDSFSTGIGLRGHIKVFCGQIDEGREDLMKALLLNPVDPHLGIWQNSIGIAALLKCEFEQALEWVKKAQSANSYWLQNYVVLVCAHSALGNQEEARQNFESLKKLAPKFSRKNWLYSHPFGDQDTQDAFVKHLSKFGF